MPELRAVISDFGGVLTAPLYEAFVSAHDGLEISPEAYGRALAAVTPEGAEPALFALERGELPEADFLALMERGLAAELGRPVSLDGFAARLMEALVPNQELFDYYRGLRERGMRLALLTNNVREWESEWRSKLPLDDVFETIVDSAFVGMRKPEPRIYALTLERLGLPADACAFVDDLAVNVDAARALGMHGVLHRDTAATIEALDGLLGPQFSQPSRSQQ
jgi:putative hydrolase of the HAD superfamily